MGRQVKVLDIETEEAWSGQPLHLYAAPVIQRARQASGAGSQPGLHFLTSVVPLATLTLAPAAYS